MGGAGVVGWEFDLEWGCTCGNIDIRVRKWEGLRGSVMEGCTMIGWSVRG